MIPNKIPVFSLKNVCISQDYEDGDKKTVVGWLKYLFLWKEDEGYSSTSAQDYKDYQRVESKLRAIIGVSKMDLHEWEDSTPLKRQISVLNKFQKSFKLEDYSG